MRTANEVTTSVARGAASSRGDNILIPAYFAVNSSVISEPSDETVQKVLDRLSSGVAVVLEGHASSDGNADWNIVLSTRRAEALKQWLVGRGAEGARITTAGRGADDPIASNETADGRAKNRRVEVRF